MAVTTGLAAVAGEAEGIDGGVMVGAAPVLGVGCGAVAVTTGVAVAAGEGIGVDEGMTVGAAPHEASASVRTARAA